MNSIESEVKICPTHPLHQAKWVCLDPMCFGENFKCCVICIKSKHQKCKDHYLIEPSKFKTKVHTIKSEFQPHKLRQAILSTLYDRIGQFNSSLAQKQEDFVNLLLFDVQGLMLNAHSIGSMKKNLKIGYNKDTGLIDISSKLEIHDENFHQSLEKFGQSVEKMYDGFINEFSKIKFVTVGGNNRLAPEDWQAHGFIAVDEEGPCIKFSRKPDMGDTNYYCAIMSTPLPESCTFKLTIMGINTNDRYLDFGIVDETKYNSIVEGGFMNSFSSGGISYCGYSNSGGLSGNMKTTGSSDPNGYNIGDSTYMEYTKGTEIKFYNENKTTDLVLNSFPNKDYYLYLVLYHKEAEGLLEKLS